ncbi:hypothetical protein ACFQZI_00255 [Mucilaginibacter lutimaris]|uniref:Rhamnan synthesis protein F n=1 Tax=Mucilaginibacter lutimaris TaxID=931629 RepID=A0ABW2Z9K0_9SPHI
MIFLSSQPDDYYFLWQLQLQVFNFRSLGIKRSDIHILLGYDVDKGLSSVFEQFISDNPGVNIHAYPDTRESKSYEPSLRWHIIAKHFRKFPALQQATVFHHDSDILFKSLPDVKLLTSDDTWYVSDCRHYLESSYIKDKIGESGFKRMCSLVGVETHHVIAEDHNAGGAQYVLKALDVAFLEKMEKDSEIMYKFLLEENKKLIGLCTHDGDNRTIQAWCADMWVIWWTALYFEKKFVIHKELEFAWAGSPAEMLEERKILHYTGAGQDPASMIFKKGDFIHYSPIDHDLSSIDRKSASGYLLEIITGYKRSNRSKRVDMLDVTIFLPVNIRSDEDLETVYAITRFLDKHFSTCTILVEYGLKPSIDRQKLPEELNHQYHRNAYLDTYGLVSTINTPYFAIWPVDVIVTIKQIQQTMFNLRTGQHSLIRAYSAAGTQVDLLLKQMFLKILSVDLFEENHDKMRPISNGQTSGPVFGSLKKIQENIKYQKLDWLTANLTDTDIAFVNGPVYRLSSPVHQCILS